MTELLAAIVLSGITIWICWFIGEKVDDNIKAKEEQRILEIDKALANKFVADVLEFVDKLIAENKIKPQDKDFVARAIIYREAKKDLIYKYIDILEEIQKTNSKQSG